jgi:hypothetical protein
MERDYKQKLKELKGLVLGGAVSRGGLTNPVGKSVTAVNAALKADTAKALLKNKLGMQAVSAKAKTMASPVKKYAGQIAKTAAKKSLLGMGAVVGAGALGYMAIKKAAKGVDKAVAEANKASQVTVDNAAKLGAHLKAEKARTGMSLSQRKEAKKQAADKEFNRKWKNKMNTTDYTKWK